jgi:hypothetical protein
MDNGLIFPYRGLGDQDTEGAWGRLMLVERVEIRPSNP